jgi:hypothetical protein
VFRRSSGSAPADFVLVATPLLLSFSALLIVIVLGYQKLQLTRAAFALAEIAALADVTDNDFGELSEEKVAEWGIPETAVSLARSNGVAQVSLARRGIAGIDVEAVGLAAIE